MSPSKTLLGLCLVIGACNDQSGTGTSAPSAPKVPAGRPAKAAPGAEGVDETLALAPFQKSAFTLVGTAAGKPSASTFEHLAGRLILHDGQPRTLEFSVEPSSLVSSSEKLAARLKDKDFFDAQAHARIEFRTREIRPVPADKAAPGAVTHLLTGDITVLGKSLPVTIPARVEVTAAAITISTQSSVGRADWGKAFASRPDDLFQDRLDLVSKLVFPRSGER